MASVFKGPQFYIEEESSIFKGREKETRDLLYIVEHSDFSVCYAVSGEGKSSLVNAGLCPRLREDGFLPIHIKNIADAENGNFDEFVWKIVKESINDLRKKEKYSGLAMLKMKPKPEDKELYDSVWWKLRTREFRINAFETVIPILIFDQFEEVFNSSKDLSWIDSFFSWLEKLYQDENPIAGDYSGKLQKNYKILFSLRSEYVCELDYWAMDKYFIPSLKNNRYYLKPLTKEAALEVASLLDQLPSTLNYDEIIRHAKAGRTGEWDKIKDNLPCVSALILSLILTGLSERDAEVEAKIEDISVSLSEDKGKDLFDFLLDNVYKKALKECGVLNNESVKDFVELFEDTLIDVNGRRRHVPERELPPIANEKLKEALNILERERIINVIDQHYEISHDCLCTVINKRRNERYRVKEQELAKAKKEAEKLKNQREEFIALAFLFPFSLVVIFLMSVIFQNKEIAVNLRVFDNIVICIFANLSILPVLIYSAIKRLKITSWGSLYGIISNVLLMFFFLTNQNEIALRLGLAVVSIGIPVTMLIYSLKLKLFGIPQAEELRIVVSSIPLLLFFWIVASFIFCLCVFNKTLGLPEPFNSSWGVFAIPLLTHEIVRNCFKQEQSIIAIVSLCFLWGLLAYNTSVEPFAFPAYIVLVIYSITTLTALWSYRSIAYWKRITAIAIESIILIIVIILNMGFNICRIKYDTVTHVFNWVDANVHNIDNRMGVVSACYGDTLLPCVFDSINYRQHYCYISSKKIVNIKDVTDYKGLYSYKKEDGLSLWQCLFIDEVENNISKYNFARIEIAASQEDSLRFYAARVYHEVRNANIRFFVNGITYNLNEVKSLDTLVNLQNKELNIILKQMYNSTTSTWSKTLDIALVLAFNKAFARSFYSLMLKDRIIRNDSVNIFNLTQEILSLYFYDAGDYELTTNSNSIINMGNFRKTIGSIFKVSDLRKTVDLGSSLEAWYNYVSMLLLMDIGSNAEDFYNNKVSRYTDILNNLQSIHEIMNLESERNLKKISELLRKGGNLNSDDLIEALNIYKRQLDISNDIKQKTNTQIDRIEIDKRQIDLDYQKLINDVFTTLSLVASNSPNIYNSEFVDICEQLYLISVYRQYEIAPVYMQYLEEMDNAKNKLYIEFKKYQEKEDSLKRIIKDFHF